MKKGKKTHRYNTKLIKGHNYAKSRTSAIQDDKLTSQANDGPNTKETYDTNNDGGGG